MRLEGLFSRRAKLKVTKVTSELSVQNITKDLVLSSDEKSNLTNEIKSLLNEPGAYVFQPNYLGNTEFSVQVASHFEDKVCEYLAVKFMYQNKIVPETELRLCIDQDTTPLVVTGLYQNATQKKRISVMGLTRLLLPVDDLICQGIANYYQQNVERRVRFMNRRIIRSFLEAGFKIDYPADDFPNSTKLFKPN